MMTHLKSRPQPSSSKGWKQFSQKCWTGMKSWTLNTFQHISTLFRLVHLPCRPMEQLPRFHGGTVTTQMRNLYRWPRTWMGQSKQDQPTNQYKLNAVSDRTSVDCGGMGRTAECGVWRVKCKQWSVEGECSRAWKCRVLSVKGQE